MAMTLQSKTLKHGLLGQVERQKVAAIPEYVLTFDVTVRGQLSDVNVDWHRQQMEATLERHGYQIEFHDEGKARLAPTSDVERLERRLAEAEMLIRQYEEDIEGVIAQRVEAAMGVARYAPTEPVMDWVSALAIAKREGKFVAADGKTWVTCEVASQQLGLSRASLSRAILGKSSAKIGSHAIEGMGRTQYLVNVRSYAAANKRGGK